MVTTGSLVAYYKLDESSGQAIDAHGVYDLTVSGATQNVSGKINTAYEFDGLNDSLKNTSLLAKSVFSTSFWVKTKAAADEAGINFGNSIVAGQFFAVDPYYNTNKCWVFFGNGNVSSSALTINDGSFHHIVVTKGGNQHQDTTIYVDGSDVTAAVTNPTNTISLGNGVTVGNRNGGNFFLSGTMDEIGIWDSELTSSDVTDLYNGGAGLAYPFAAAGSNFLFATTDIATITDNFVSFSEFNRDLTENTNVTDLLIRTVTFNRDLTESITISDNLVTIIEKLLSLSDNLSVSDNLIAVKEIRRIISDAINVADNLESASEFLKSLTETLSLADTLTKTSEFNRSLAETLSVADALVVQGVTNFLESLSETISMADNLTKSSQVTKTITENIGINDDLAKISAFKALLSDTTEVADSFDRIVEYFRNLSDTEQVSDSIIIPSIVIGILSKLFTLRVPKNNFKLQVPENNFPLREQKRFKLK